MDQLLTIKEVADTVQKHPNSIRGLVKAGKLAAIKLGKDWRVDPLDLKKYLDSRKTKKVA